MSQRQRVGTERGRVGKSRRDREGHLGFGVAEPVTAGGVAALGIIEVDSVRVANSHLARLLRAARRFRRA